MNITNLANNGVQCGALELFEDDLILLIPLRAIVTGTHDTRLNRVFTQ